MSTEGSYGEEVTERLKSLYIDKRETIEYMLKFGSPIERAKAGLVKSIALSGKTSL